MASKKAITIDQLQRAAKQVENLQESLLELNKARQEADIKFKELIQKASSKTVKDFVLKFNGGSNEN